MIVNTRQLYSSILDILICHFFSCAGLDTARTICQDLRDGMTLMSVICKHTFCSLDRFCDL